MYGMLFFVRLWNGFALLYVLIAIGSIFQISCFSSFRIPTDSMSLLGLASQTLHRGCSHEGLEVGGQAEWKGSWDRTMKKIE